MVLIAQEFDFAYETTDRLTCIQVKLPSLSDYDEDGVDGEDAEERLCLNRWGDLRVPDRLLTV